MRETGKHFDKTSISSRLRALILQLAVPLSLLSLFVVLVFLLSSLSLAQVSRNISTASRFNQNFKDEVDLKMYYFVTGSNDQLPWDEVQAAEDLATELLENTRSRESHRAATSVLDLCQNLRRCIQEIEATDGYDLRMHQLESNIYVITELIQKYIYTYLPHFIRISRTCCKSYQLTVFICSNSKDIQFFSCFTERITPLREI